MNIKTIFTLIKTRNKEFYRDRGSLIWAILFPLLIITGITFAFKNEDQELFNVGVLKQKTSLSQQESLTIPFLQEPWIKVIAYNSDNSSDKNKTQGRRTQSQALKRIRHHQLDLLIQNQGDHLQYWINPTSSRSNAIEKLLLAQYTLNDSSVKLPPLKRSAIEGRAIRYVDWVIPGILGMNIMFGALFGIGYVIVRYRKMEVLKRIQATPVSALDYLSAQVISRLFIMLTISSLIFTACNIVLGFMMEGSYLLLFLVAFMGGFSLITLGLVISSRTDNEELAGGLLNFATFPMMFLSEVWFSLDDAPDWMSALSQALPLTHMVTAARKIMLEGAGFSEVSFHLGVLGVISLVLLFTASKLFRWSKS